jgi:ATP-dependent DNA helicase RecG
MQALLREETTLDVATGRFVTVTDIPRFAWLEAIVNAVTHRSYSMQGDHIRISVFDDRVEVHNPGQLPGPVRLDNIRHTRFSRNPRIARALAELGIVQELNEGVPRMFDEMARAGLPEPQFSLTESGFKVVLRRFGEDEKARLLRITESVPEWMLQPLETLLQDRRITTGQVAQLGRVSEPTARRYLQRLESMGELRRIASGPRDPNAYWEFATPIRGHWRLQSLARVRTRRRN